MTRNQAFGADRERKVKKQLEAEGFFVFKAGGSLGAADLGALKKGEPPQLIQVKGNTGGPFSKFGPAAREELRRVAEAAGAVALLAWWPPRDVCRWIPEPEWPQP